MLERGNEILRFLRRRRLFVPLLAVIVLVAVLFWAFSPLLNREVVFDETVTLYRYEDNSTLPSEEYYYFNLTKGKVLFEYSVIGAPCSFMFYSVPPGEHEMKALLSWSSEEARISYTGLVEIPVDDAYSIYVMTIRKFMSEGDYTVVHIKITKM